MLKTHLSLPDLKRSDGSTNIDKEKAEVLNNYFRSLFTNDSIEVIPDAMPTDIEFPPTELKITSGIAKEKLSELKPHKSPGLDNLRSKVLFEVTNEIATHITTITNKSLVEGHTPQDRKDAKVTPIYKKESSTTLENYRPVNLTSIICKTARSIVKNEIMSHLVVNNLLSPYQHGFVRGKSCITPSIRMFTSLDKDIEKGVCRFHKHGLCEGFWSHIKDLLGNFQALELEARPQGCHKGVFWDHCSLSALLMI